MRLVLTAAALAAALSASVPASAQDMPKLVIAMSGWTGFAPLSLAEKAGLFKKNGVDVEIKFIPQKDRHLAVANGSVQGAATTVDTHIVWNSAGVALTQVLLLDKSNGGDGVAVRPAITGWADLKGKTVAVDGPGTTPYFVLIYMMKRNGLSVGDVKYATLSPQNAAQAFVAGQYDAASTYEPYLSTVRENASAGRILATTVDYPIVIDTLAFPPDYIAKNPKAVAGVVAGFFDAVEMIRTEPAKAYEIMGAVVKQSGEQFAGSAKFIAWQDKAKNQAFFQKEAGEFMDYASKILLEANVIKTAPALPTMINADFVK